MIETPADYRSFIFFGQIKPQSVRFARVSEVLFKKNFNIQHSKLNLQNSKNESL